LYELVNILLLFFISGMVRVQYGIYFIMFKNFLKIALIDIRSEVCGIKH